MQARPLTRQLLQGFGGAEVSGSHQLDTLEEELAQLMDEEQARRTRSKQDMPDNQLGVHAGEDEVASLAGEKPQIANIAAMRLPTPAKDDAQTKHNNAMKRAFIDMEMARIEREKLAWQQDEKIQTPASRHEMTCQWEIINRVQATAPDPEKGLASQADAAHGKEVKAQQDLKEDARRRGQARIQEEARLAVQKGQEFSSQTETDRWCGQTEMAASLAKEMQMWEAKALIQELVEQKEKELALKAEIDRCHFAEMAALALAKEKEEKLQQGLTYEADRRAKEEEARTEEAARLGVQREQELASQTGTQVPQPGRCGCFGPSEGRRRKETTSTAGRPR